MAKLVSKVYFDDNGRYIGISLFLIYGVKYHQHTLMIFEKQDFLK